MHVENPLQTLHTYSIFENIVFLVYESPFITGALEIAEGFKSFFAGIGTELAGSITITPANINFESFLGPETEEDFIFARVTPETLNKIVGKLKTKNSSGNDNNISTKLLNSAIINQSTLF